MEPTTKKTTAVKTKKDNKVAVFIQKWEGGSDPNYYAGVNGKAYLIPKGKESLVPPEVAAEVERARRAAAKRDNNIDKLAMAESK